MNKRTYGTLSALLLAVSLTAHAEGVQKLGYVNPERVYTETKTAQRIEADLQREFGTRQRQISALQQEGVKLQQQLAGGKLSGSQQQETEGRLMELIGRYRRESAQLAEEYSLRRNEEFAALQNNANAVIKDIAEREQYDLIVQEAVFVSGKFDITDRVIKRLDEIK